MNTKTIFRVFSIMAIVMFTLVFNGYAQDGPPPGGDAPAGAPAGGGGDDERFTLINDAVGLTPDQVDAIKAELVITNEEIGKTREVHTEWGDAAAEAMNNVFAEETERMCKHLTAEQQVKYKAWIKAWLEERAQDSH